MAKTSEFGKGVVYPLGLFLAHAERHLEVFRDVLHDYGCWFNASADHLYEMEEIGVPKIDKKIRKLRDYVFKRRLLIGDKVTQEEMFKAINMAKDLMFSLDKYYGNKPIKATWS